MSTFKNSVIAFTLVAGLATPAAALACHQPVHHQPKPTPIVTPKPSPSPKPSCSPSPKPTPSVSPKPTPVAPTPTPVVTGGQGAVLATSTVATTLPQTGSTDTALEVAVAAGLAGAAFLIVKRSRARA